MKYLSILAITALAVLTSCIDDSVWADDLPSRHDIVQWELEDNYEIATEINDLYGVMIILTENDSIVLQCRDNHNYRTGNTEDIDLVVDVNQVWVYKDIFYPDGNVRRFRLEWLYHNTHSSSIMYYQHEPGYRHLNESLKSLSIVLYTSIDPNRPENKNLQRLWKEIDYENKSQTYP